MEAVLIKGDGKELLSSSFPKLRRLECGSPGCPTTYVFSYVEECGEKILDDMCHRANNVILNGHPEHKIDSYEWFENTWVPHGEAKAASGFWGTRH
jgi:hypothetical protein